ncbi:MAG TPA: rhomboid family intramembrane serine protease, partial [Planctomycetota bacterium]|nr:rhomboid family intramembrane serine protease [Planctomycetota bacterium]
SGTVVVGASGAVTGVAAAAVVLMGRKRIDFFGVLSIPVWLLGVVYIGWDLIAAILFIVDPKTFDSGVAVQAHLGGAIAGAAMWWRPRSAAGPRGRSSRAVARDEAARAAREDGEAARVDALLARIHESGIGALTEEERAFLKRVSTRYRR